jgi:hypothetical protein
MLLVSTDLPQINSQFSQTKPETLLSTNYFQTPSPSPNTIMVWSEQMMAGFKARRANYEENYVKVDDFVCQDQAKVSPHRFSIEKKWKPTPSAENARPDDWLGSPSTKKRSWKVKSIITDIPDPDAEE